MEKVEVFDTTCRDGEQATDGFKNGLDSKLLIAHKLEELGVDTIEAGFPNSSKGDFKAVKRIAQEVEGPYICGLARCIKGDIDRAWEAIRFSEKPTLHVFTYMVDPKSLKAYGISDFNEVLEDSVGAVQYSKNLMKGKGRVEFSAQNATIGDKEQIYKLYSEVIEAGANVVNLPDTAGYSWPCEIFDFVDGFTKSVNTEEVIISTHCHNDLGNAVANSIAAVKAGTRQVECTINGIGERAGNAALEEVVMNLKTREEGLGLTIDIKTEMLSELSRMVSNHSGYEVQPNKAVVGRNAFRHSSGVHQDGVLKGAGYEIMKPEDVGWDGESIEITARSGKKGYLHRLEKLGYDKEVISSYLDEIVKRGKNLADEKGKLDDIDLRFIVEEIMEPIEREIVCKDKKIIQENGDYKARVTIRLDGMDREEEAWSDEGVVDALYSAVDRAVCIKTPTLVVYDPKNIGRGHSTEAEVRVVLSDNGYDGSLGVKEPAYIGKARDPDTLEASVEAYVCALNRYLMKR